MGGKDAGPGTEVKKPHHNVQSWKIVSKVMPETGKGEEFGYNSPEFFQYDKYSYFDIEKDVVDGGKRVEQPKSGQTDFWWMMTWSVAAAVLFNCSVGEKNIG